MNVDQKAIMKRKAFEDMKHDTALEIRKLLDTARKRAEAEGRDADETEQEILALVTEEDVT